MLVIVDSGSTKCDWACIEEGQETRYFQTAGLNPFYFTDQTLLTTLTAEEDIAFLVDQPINLYFFGAGCADLIQITKMEKCLAAAFPKHQSIHVHQDLKGAVLATCGAESGISCILGTGSNACYFNGTEIIQNTSSLGLYLGDEGSGGYLSKHLLKAFFYNQLPTDLHTAFSNQYELEKDVFLDHIYSKPKPNTYVAGFFPFLVEHRDHEFVLELVHRGFTEFIDNHVLCYDQAKEVPIHFIGSVAFLFRTELKQVLESKGLEFGNLIQKPLEGMIKNVHLMKAF